MQTPTTSHRITRTTTTNRPKDLKMILVIGNLLDIQHRLDPKQQDALQQLAATAGRK